MKTKNQWLPALAVVIGVGSLLRFVNLSLNPGYFNDEGSMIVAARSLSQGGWNYFGIGDSILLIGWPPLFAQALAWIYQYFPTGIITLRMITAALGVTTGVILYWLPGHRQGSNRLLGFFSGLFWAVLPFAVLYNRLGFTYNLITVLVLFCFIALFEYQKTGRWTGLMVSGLLTGIGLLTNLWMAAVIPIHLLIPLFRNRKDFLIGFASLLLFPAIYAGWMLATDPGTFLYDLNFVFSRVQFSLQDQIGLVVANFSLLLVEQSWVLLGLIGIFVIEEKRLRNMLLAFYFVTFVFAARSVALVGIGSYQFLPLAPFIVIGLANFHLAAWRYLNQMLSEWFQAAGFWKNIRRRTRAMLGAVLVALLLGLPWLFVVVQQAAALGSSLPNELSGVLVDPANARAAADYVNARVGAEDVVVASPAASWLMDGRVTDYQVSLAYDGFETRHFPTDIPQERFTFNASVENARFVVVDRIWDNWAAFNVPDMDIIFDEITAWELVAEFGEFRVYQNPR